MRRGVDAKVPRVRRSFKAGPGAEEDTELNRVDVGSETEAVGLEDRTVEISVCDGEDLDLIRGFPEEKGIRSVRELAVVLLFLLFNESAGSECVCRSVEHLESIVAEADVVGGEGLDGIRVDDEGRVPRSPELGKTRTRRIASRSAGTIDDELDVEVLGQDGLVVLGEEGRDEGDKVVCVG